MSVPNYAFLCQELNPGHLMHKQTTNFFQFASTKSIHKGFAQFKATLDLNLKLCGWEVNFSAARLHVRSSSNHPTPPSPTLSLYFISASCNALSELLNPYRCIVRRPKSLLTSICLIFLRIRNKTKKKIIISRKP